MNYADAQECIRNGWRIKRPGMRFWVFGPWDPSMGGEPVLDQDESLRWLDYPDAFRPGQIGGQVPDDRYIENDDDRIANDWISDMDPIPEPAPTDEEIDEVARIFDPLPFRRQDFRKGGFQDKHRIGHARRRAKDAITRILQLRSLV